MKPHKGVLSYNGIGTEGIFYSAMKQQWVCAFDSNGTVEGLLPRAWFDTKREALLDLKRALEFRLGLTADCTRLYERLDAIDRELANKNVKRETAG
jgi:hypothetical protein